MRRLVAVTLGLLLGLPALASAIQVVPFGGTAPLPEQKANSPKLAAAIEALRAGDADTGLRLAREAVKEQPRSAVAHEVLGAAASSKRELKEAEKAFEEALRLEPRRTSAMIALGRVALDQGDPKKAEQLFRKALAITPTLATARRNLAIALLRQGQAKAAVSGLEQALDQPGAKDADTQYLLAAMYYELRRLPEAEKTLEALLAAHPDLQQAILLQGLVKLDLRKTAEADVLLQKVVERDPKSPWARLGLAVIDRAQGQVAESRTALEKLVAEHPEWSLAHLQLGQTLLAQRQPEAALKAFGRAEATSPNPAWARLRTAQVLLALGHTDAAIEHAGALLKVPATAPAARALRIQAYVQKRDFPGAEREMKAAAAAAPSDPAPVLQLGRLYLIQGRDREALAQFDHAAQIRPGLPDALAGRAEAYMGLGQPKSAVDAAAAYVKARQDAADAQVFLGTVHERLGQTADAERAYQKALERERHQVLATRALAALYDRDNRTAEAMKLLTDTANGRPDTAAPLVDLGVIQARTGDNAAAAASYRRALSRDPGNVVALNNLAYLLGRDAQTLDEGLELAERAYRQAPGNAAVADTAGWLHFQKGNLEKARTLIAAAVQIAPREPQLRYHLGMVYLKQGKKAEARKELELALQNPTFEEASAAREALKSLP
jgi:tetratricopeptide (TPR) repeat protein